MPPITKAGNPDAYPVYGNAATLGWAASTRRSD